MNSKAGLWTILIVVIALAAYTVTRVFPEVHFRAWVGLALATFAAIETAVAFWFVFKPSKQRLALAHGLSALGFLAVGYSTLHEEGLLLLVAGTALFSTGTMLGVKDHQVTAGSAQAGSQSPSQNSGE